MPAVDYWVPARASPVEPGSLGRDDRPYAIALSRKDPQEGSAATPRRHVRVCHGVARRPSHTTMALEAMPAKPMLNMPMMMPGNEWFT